MRNRNLGLTGIKVSQLCLGAMMFGAWGNPDHADSIRIIHGALDAGINFVDTADMYSAGESEEIVGKALTGRRDNVILATKVHGAMSSDPNEQGNSRRRTSSPMMPDTTRLRSRRLGAAAVPSCTDLTSMRNHGSPALRPVIACPLTAVRGRSPC